MATKTREPIVARYDICNSVVPMFIQACARMKWAIEQKPINASQLQKDAGLSNGTLYRFGVTEGATVVKNDADVSTIMRICMALNVSADWLLFGDGTFRGLPCGEPSLRPEPYDVARDEAARATASAGVRPSASTPSRSVTSQGVDIPDRIVTPDAVSSMLAYLRTNAGSTTGITAELVAQALQPSAGIQSAPSSPSACAYDDIILKGASNDVLLAIIRQLQSQNDALQQQHVRDIQLLSEAQTKNTALQSVNTTLRQTIAQLSTSLSVSLPKVGDILSPTSPSVPGTPSPSASDDGVSFASDDAQSVTK